MEALIRKSDVWISNTRREDDHQDREKYLAYLEQSRKTEGYEVTISRGRGVCGGVLPMDMSKERRAMRLKPGLDEQGDLLVFATMLDTVAIICFDLSKNLPISVKLSTHI
ncbi:hypothetical protein C3L33_05495, partial [Rhododendron williamsianum]